MLLGLQPAGIDVDQPRELGEPHHPVDRLVGDVRLAHERHHVMLAMGVEGDVAHQHEIVVLADLAEGALEHVGRAFAIAGIELVVGVDHAPGRIDQALAAGIVAGIGDERAHRRQRFLARRLGDDRLGGRPHVIGQGGLLVATIWARAGRAGWTKPGLTTASIAVSPFDRPRGRGCHRGGRISHTRSGGFDPCAATGRRIPILHGFFAWLRPHDSTCPLGAMLAPADQSLYIPS